ncbi:Putative ribonuclease H protein At1g65750 [Linum perenne]
MFFADDLVLFGYATERQAGVINCILDKFSSISGQEVSRDKSRIYFSSNVRRPLQVQICSIFGMQGTQDLGRYLGVPIIHGRNLKHLYRYLIERIDKKLAGWKVNSLSFAGRVSLALSALNTIPAYTMQTAMLPNEVCNDIDRRIRSFIWGLSNGGRKLHLLNWEQVCQPKAWGGLGIRSSKEMNLAFLMKLTWGMIKDKEALWVKVLKTKYLKQTESGLIPKKTKRWSSCWKGINATWTIFTGGLYWSVQNGRKTNFWKERWLDDGTVIGDLIQIPAGHEDGVIADFCDSSGSWDIEKLTELLPLNIVQSVVGMTPPCPDLGDDFPIWGLEPNGSYSVKTGYLLAKELVEGATNGIWKKIWSWKGPQRIRQFLWTAVHNRLLTNTERQRRHLTNSAECGLCVDTPESLDHILRHCPLAEQVWSRTMPPDKLTDFFFLDPGEWWKRYIGDVNLSPVFGITCWLLWKARNERIFEGKSTSVHGILEQGRFWLNASSSAYQSVVALKQTQGNEGSIAQIYWTPAQEPTFTLNTDGSVKVSAQRAAAGGCLRNSEGRVIDVFAANLGNCSITRAELTGVVIGLERAWNIGIRQVEVQTDSAVVVKLVSKDALGEHQHATLVSRLRNLIQRSWQVSVKFIYREANHLADSLANKGHDLALGVHSIDSSESSVLYWAKYDLVGGSESRTIFA